ncbi:VanZ family protein [Candidatus Bipolaricaulota bacterium]|nr:VanZ family protein [Candidatus Bipolaricaulota bacterium]MBS3814279.1 VanZ family protein [Candidatus Bipolaricaulota bacterium]MBS3825306.1 VanZ family protein [Candidatus Bipolaricaulota bacterium]
MNQETLSNEEVARKVSWTLVFLAYSGAVFYFSVRPIQEGAPVIGITGMDKLVHAGEFTLYALLGYRAIKYYVKAEKTIHTLAGVSVIYGTLTELSQLFFYYRSASVLDWLANVLGITIGLMIIILHKKRGSKT